MGIYTALSTAVGGLNAQAYALEQISGNIANSQTTGFKRTDTSFQDLVTESLSTRQDAASVRAFSRPTNDIQGDIVGNSTPTYMAINGDGYFVIGQRSGQVDGRSVFDDLDIYTRRGDFERDSEGYLVNGSGYYLKGIPINQTTGNPVGTSPQVIQVTNDLLPALTTTNIQYRANLPSYPFSSNADPNTPNSELLTPADYTVNPTVAGDGVVQGQDAARFLDDTIAGGAVTGYMPSGAAVNAQFRWAKIDNTLGSETWNLFYLRDSNATGTATAWQNVGQDFVFDGAGTLTTPANNRFTITGLNVEGSDLGDVTVDFGTNGLTQFDDVDGAVQVTDLRQNGYPAGEFAGVSISEEGRVVVSYGNGQTISLSQISLAAFSADNRLTKGDGGAFFATADSGVAVLSAPGTIIGSSLEGSNTEIADEFTKLIVTQQAYSANTRIVTTADEMIDEVLNIVR